MGQASPSNLFLIIKIDEVSLLNRTDSVRTRLVAELEAHCAKRPEFRHLFVPVANLVRAMPSGLVSYENADVSLSAWQQSDEIVQALLVMAQRITSNDPMAKSDGETQLHVPSELAASRDRMTSLRVSETIQRTTSLIEDIGMQLSSKASSAAVPLLLSRILPFVVAMAEAFAQNVMAFAYTVKSVYKLSYVVGRVMLDLAEKGYCKPSDETETSSGDQEGQDGENVEGTGIGTGTGDKNVSAEIEDEAQVEGMQGEQDEQERQSGAQDEEDDAMSMDEDFEGLMGEGKEKDNQEGSDHGDEEEDHEDHVGDVDPLDPGAVDEKFWGEEDKPHDEKDGQDDVAKGGTKDVSSGSELRAKEQDERQSDRPDKEKTDEANEPSQDNQQTDTEPKDDDSHGVEDRMEDDDEGHVEPSHQDDSQVAIPEGAKLDLPDDLDFGSDHHEENENDLDEDITLSERGEGEEGEEFEGRPSDGPDALSDQDDAGNEDGPPPTGVADEELNELQEDATHNLDLSASNEAQAQDNFGSSKGLSGTAEQPEQTSQGQKQDKMDMDADVGEMLPSGKG